MCCSSLSYITMVWYHTVHNYWPTSNNMLGEHMTINQTLQWLIPSPDYWTRSWRAGWQHHIPDQKGTQGKHEISKDDGDVVSCLIVYGWCCHCRAWECLHCHALCQDKMQLCWFDQTQLLCITWVTGIYLTCALYVDLSPLGMHTKSKSCCLHFSCLIFFHALHA